MREEKKIEGESRKAEPGGLQSHLVEPEELMSREQPEGQSDAENTQLVDSGPSEELCANGQS